MNIQHHLLVHPLTYNKTILFQPPDFPISLVATDGRWGSLLGFPAVDDLDEKVRLYPQIAHLFAYAREENRYLLGGPAEGVREQVHSVAWNRILVSTRPRTRGTERVGERGRFAC